MTHLTPRPTKITFVQAESPAFSTHRAVLSERTGGISSPPYSSLNMGRTTPDDPATVLRNEEMAVAALGIPDRLARIHLEHGANILVADRPGMIGTGDALVTSVPGLTLSLTVADCYPVALRAGSIRALVHCGWRSVAGGILEALIGRDAALPSPMDVHVWIGPGIGACCYPVGKEVAESFPESLLSPAAALAAAATTAGSDTPRSGTRNSGNLGAATVCHLDLAAEIESRLQSLGVPKKQVERSRLCTSCHPNQFFSHRRDGFPSGRMAAFLT